MSININLNKKQKVILNDLAERLGLIKASNFINVLLSTNTFEVIDSEGEELPSVLHNIQSNISQLEIISSEYVFRNNIQHNPKFDDFYNTDNVIKVDMYKKHFQKKTNFQFLHLNPNAFNLIRDFFLYQLKQIEEIKAKDKGSNGEATIQEIETPNFYLDSINEFESYNELNDQMYVKLDEDISFDKFQNQDALLHHAKYLNSLLDDFQNKVNSYDDCKYFKQRIANKMNRLISNFDEAVDKIQLRETKIIINQMNQTKFINKTFKQSNDVIELHNKIMDELNSLNTLIKNFHEKEKVSNGLVSDELNEKDIASSLINNFCIISLRIERILNDFKQKRGL
ncbi:hypothetical protein [Vibrio furnissii]|uniref:hypothetical protein n=1 Tax=Vibrio furnissii TaxID=29494 RepID=UPI001EEAE387|nr:hypothetical protein [Vibrio furnissii]MCG6268592.1 hypothetical protein [Vibrio furnissii]